jgi:hypothetical protein
MDHEEPSANDDMGLGERLAELRQQHAGLDAEVSALEAEPRPDQIQIARLKKRKLVIRDLIAQLEDQITPDIIA